MPPTKIEVGQTVVPGAFYWSKQPGGWADAVTGIHFPGPIVKIDKVTRQIVAVDSMPAPVQLPTHKESFSLTNLKEKTICEFDRVDAEALCEGLNLALQTGNIEIVPMEVVKELYPKAWEKRQDKIVFKRGSALQPTKPLGDLLNDFMQTRRVRLKAGETPDLQDDAKSKEREQDRINRVNAELQNTNPSLIPQTAQTPDGSAPTPPEPTAPNPPMPPAPPTTNEGNAD